MNCPICNKDKCASLGVKNGYDISKCGNCLTFSATKASDAADDFDYSHYYREENLVIPDFVYDTYRNVIKEFEPHRKNNRFLDVGCGAGTLLEIAEELKWDAVGLEVSKPAAEHLRKRGLKVVEGTLEEANFPDGYFDVITCTEVIEHVDDPKGLLKEIARILAPNGVLWMTTPHSQGFSGKMLGVRWSVVAPPEHLNLFSIKSLRMCLEEVGLKKNRLISSGFNPFELYQAFRGADAVDPAASDAKTAKPPVQADGFERVKKSYKLNKWFVSGKYKQKVKNFINLIINKTNSGDTIKVWAKFK